MWLDRLGAQHNLQSPSNPNSRPISPLPRRVSSQRGSPYITSQSRSTRGSDTSLVSSNSDTGSSVSLLRGSSGRPNGGQLGTSSLRQTTTVDDGSESLAVLGKILGGEVAAEPVASSGAASPGPRLEDPFSSTISQEDLEIEFDFGGVSLREFVARGDDGGPSAGVHRSQTVEEYEQAKTKYEDLHRSIRACDDVLSSVETNLTSFRDDLAAVSADIEHLQARSTALNVRLENRKAVEKGLGPVVEELSVSPVVVSEIAEGHVDESWVKMLAEVEKRSEAVAKSSKQQQGQGQSRALADLAPLLEKLTLKAIERIRDYFVAQVKALRSPHMNAQIIQQQKFLKYKELYAFLHRHHSQLADEISLAYMNTMRWYYLNQFGRYQKALDKIKLHVIDKTDVLGHEDTSRKGTVLGGGGRGLSGPPHDAFNLGRRIDLLKTPNQTALSSYLAEEDQSTHYLEVPFRNFNLALLDNATAEYTFLASFFTPSLTLARVGKNFNYIFDPTFQLGQGLTRSLTSETYDGLGLLLCIRLNQHFAFELQRRRVPAMDGYVNGTSMALWPRLQAVMDAHCESVRGLTSSLPQRPLPAATARTTSAAPHVATQRFGQLVHGILSLSGSGDQSSQQQQQGSGGSGDDEPVAASLGRLRSEMEAFLTRYSQVYFGADVKGRKRERFLYNNYSLILTIIGDLGGGKMAAEQIAHFEGLKTAFQEAA